MALKLQDIDPEVDFPAIAKCLAEAYEDPPQPFLHIWFPIDASSDEAREASIQEGAERLKLWHTYDPSSRWHKVVDAETGRIAGGAAWNVFETNPFAEPHDMEVSWFPNDSSRRYAEQAIESHGRPRYIAGQRPHLCKSSVKSRHDPHWSSRLARLLSLVMLLTICIRPLQCFRSSGLSPSRHWAAGHGLGREEGR